MPGQPEIKNMALFCDFENVALGVREAKYPKFDIQKVLERLLLKGSIVVRKAYCDWDRYKEFKAGMHEAAFELIEIPHVRQSGKNSADIRMVVDALDLCYTKSHVDTFVVISGDSDFSPLVSKLRENNKLVIGVGVKKSTSDLLTAACDEFIYYDDLVLVEAQKEAQKKKRSGRKSPSKAAAKEAGKDGTKEAAARDTGREATREAGKEGTSPVQDEPLVPREESSARDEAPPARNGNEEERRQMAIDLVVETTEALHGERGEEERVWGSMVKQAIKRRKPGFNESYYGFRSFGAVLEEAEKRGLLQLERDERSGGYIISIPTEPREG
ncbi:MAG: NYN domain-containing protein [Betaproteobacteria bacterium]|nr:NYN domain-containing protein [Betaproteobacteria bacterium]